MQPLTDSLYKLQQALGYSFTDIEYLKLALRHRSAGAINNERLEFLGDAALNFCIARKLFNLAQEASEGELTRIRASLVNRSTLASLAIQLELPHCMQLGLGEVRSGGRHRPSIQSDALEAVFGAILLDGGFDACEGVIIRLYDNYFEHLPDAEELKDAKSRLQEYLQSKGLGLPQYTMVHQADGRQNKHFEITCEAAQYGIVTGIGASRRKAEQAAAGQMLEQILNAN